MKPWKRRAVIPQHPPHFALQWGHGDEAVEELSMSTNTPPITWLQWGHGDEAVEEGSPPGPFGAKDLGLGLREGRPAGVSNRSRTRAMKS